MYFVPKYYAAEYRAKHAAELKEKRLAKYAADPLVGARKQILYLLNRALTTKPLLHLSLSTACIRTRRLGNGRPHMSLGRRMKALNVNSVRV